MSQTREQKLWVELNPEIWVLRFQKALLIAY